MFCIPRQALPRSSLLHPRDSVRRGPTYPGSGKRAPSNYLLLLEWAVDDWLPVLFMETVRVCKCERQSVSLHLAIIQV